MMNNQNQQNNFERRNESQIIRKDGRGVIFEVMDNSFNIEKVVMNFQKYDKDAPAGQKVQDRITIYMDFAQVLRMANDFAVTGRGFQRMRAEKAEADKNGQNYWGIQLSMGGTSTVSLARQNRSRADGKPEFRALSIMPSYKGNGIALSAISGPGKVTQTGGYASDGAPDSRVQLALSIDDWIEVLLITKASIEAYLGYKYATVYPRVQEERRQYAQQRQQNNQAQQNNQGYQQRSNQGYQQTNNPTPVNQGYQAIPSEATFDIDDNLDAFGQGPMGASSGDPVPF